MKNNILVQRAQFKDIADKDIVGIDCLLKLDYMGSAEFEFGSLPDSLKKVVRVLDDYCCVPTKFKCGNDTIHIICKRNEVNDVNGLLDYLSVEEFPRNDKFWSKENTRFKSALEGKDKTRCWWDIANHWFACVGKSNANKLMIGLRAFKELRGL